MNTTRKQDTRYEDSWNRARRFVADCEYGPGTGKALHVEAVYGRTAPTVQVWFEVDVSDKGKAQLILDDVARLLGRPWCGQPVSVTFEGKEL